MLEVQEENDMLGLLEDRIEQSINLIHRLRQDKTSLEEEVSRLRDEIGQRDLRIQEIGAQNESLKTFFSIHLGRKPNLCLMSTLRDVRNMNRL